MREHKAKAWKERDSSQKASQKAQQQRCALPLGSFTFGRSHCSVPSTRLGFPQRRNKEALVMLPVMYQGWC